MQYEDWRLATPAEVAPLLSGEGERWVTDLGWDIAAGLKAAEEGRRSGRIPGFIARAADGGCAGFTFFSVDRGILSLGMLTGERADVVRALLDLALDSPEASFARRYQGFLFPRSPVLAVALTRRRFTLAAQRFLALTNLGGSAEGSGPGRAWREEDLPNVVRLLARAYAGTPASAAFAPEGRLDEWMAYLGQLTRAAACGTFLPGASVVVPGERADRPAAAVLVTRTSPAVWHVAQIAVDPANRRQGLARRLVQSVREAAGAAGAREVTLVVDERNDAARALYASMGFDERATLLFGSRPRLTRVYAAESALAASN